MMPCVLPASRIRQALGSVDPPAPTVATLTWPLWGAFALLTLTFGLGDFLTTAADFSLTSGHEASPLTAFLLHWGIWPLAVTKVLVLALVWLVARVILIDGWREGRWLLTAAIYFTGFFFAWVCLSNLMALVLGDDLVHFVLQVFSEFA